MKNLKNIFFPLLIGCFAVLCGCQAEYTDCTPNEAHICDTVRWTIGGHYVGATTVYFNGIESPEVFQESIEGESGRKLAAIVPPRASSGPIRIVNNTGLGTLLGFLSSDVTFEDDFTIYGTAIPIPPVRFIASPTLINPGETTTLSWVPAPYYSFTGLFINGGDFVNLDVLLFALPELEVRPSETTTYELRKEHFCLIETETATVTVMN